MCVGAGGRLLLVTHCYITNYPQHLISHSLRVVWFSHETMIKMSAGAVIIWGLTGVGGSTSIFTHLTVGKRLGILPHRPFHGAAHDRETQMESWKWNIVTLITQTNPGPIWEGITQGCGYEEEETIVGTLETGYSRWWIGRQYPCSRALIGYDRPIWLQEAEFWEE